MSRRVKARCDVAEGDPGRHGESVIRPAGCEHHHAGGRVMALATRLTSLAPLDARARVGAGETACVLLRRPGACVCAESINALARGLSSGR